MSKTRGVTIENQLVAARARKLGGEFQGSLTDALVRLEHLRQAIQTLDETPTNELFRYFPVAAIAVLETHFKAVVQIIVDAGSPYLERGLALTKDRLRSFPDILPLLHHRTVTVGELVAHLLPFNSITSLEEAFDDLLEVKLKTILGAICDPFCVRGGLECSPIIEDIDALWRNLAETFERRHILAHEAATNYVVTSDQAINAVDCVTTFAMAIDALLWETAWKNRPLTAGEMRHDTDRRHQNARSELAKALRLGRTFAERGGRQKEFRQLHGKWREYGETWARWEAEDFGRGSMRLLVASTSRMRLYRARAQDVMEWCAWFEPMATVQSQDAV